VIRDWNLKEDAQHVTREWLDRNGYYEIPHIWICNTEERTDFAAALGRCRRYSLFSGR